MSSLTERQSIMTLVTEAVRTGARQDRACQVISLSERTLQRWQRDQARGDQRPQRVQAPKNALSMLERQEVLAVAQSDEFGQLCPSQIVPRLADQGRYIASESTFYRVLRAARQLKHRGADQPPIKRAKPRALSATAPNQLFSWDITYLPTLVMGRYFYLYLFLDIFSRKVVGWQIYESESSDLASEVMRDICSRENIAPNQVVLHSDNGSPMKGATMLATLQTLGVMPTFSRPSVSNDNPYSESLFRTLKYRPEYPHRAFETLLVARQWVGQFVHWYNLEHKHSGIRYVSPQQRHTGEDHAILSARHALYTEARERNPARWARHTRDWSPMGPVTLNPERDSVVAAYTKAEDLKQPLAA